MLMKALDHLPPCGGPPRDDLQTGRHGWTMMAIIMGMQEDTSPLGDRRGASVEQSNPGLSEARLLLKEMEESEGAAALAPAKRLVDVLEDLLEGREGEPG